MFLSVPLRENCNRRRFGGWPRGRVGWRGATRACVVVVVVAVVAAGGAGASQRELDGSRGAGHCRSRQTDAKEKFRTKKVSVWTWLQWGGGEREREKTDKVARGLGLALPREQLVGLKTTTSGSGKVVSIDQQCNKQGLGRLCHKTRACVCVRARVCARGRGIGGGGGGQVEPRNTGEIGPILCPSCRT